MSPTARSLKACRDAGFACHVVERWNPHAKVRQDLFGFIDILAITDQGILGIQATSAAHHSERIGKIAASPHAAAWLRAGGRIEVWSWAKRKIKRGGKAVRWELRRTAIEV